MKSTAMKLLSAAALAIGLIATQDASAATINTTVNGTDNIYFSNWGSSNNGINKNVTGLGTAVSAVSDGSGAVNFATLGPLMSIATGSVVDKGVVATNADGEASLFNGLRVYSMIGVWSSTAGSITAIGDSFFVGTSATIIVPTVTAAYLFLGENDGIFSDNSGAYSVTIKTSMTPVPLPAGLPLLLVGVGGLGLISRRKRATG